MKRVKWWLPGAGGGGCVGKGELKYCRLDRMRRQRNILQAKEQDKKPTRQNE